MTYYAVIDTNVLVSALLTSHDDAATVQVVNKIFAGDVIPLFSEEILSEYNEVLRRRKFNFSGSLVSEFIDAIKKCGHYVLPSPIDEFIPDEKDLPFYSVVMTKADDGAYLITGNIKHFPHKPFIVTPNEFISLINGLNK